MLALSGISLSSGIALGRAHRLKPRELEIPRRTLTAGDIETEVARFHAAVDATRRHLDELIANLEKKAPGAHATAHEFLDTHRLLLRDPEIIDGTVASIRETACNAEWAVQARQTAIAETFAEIEDPYLKARIEDIEHVTRLIIEALTDGRAPVLLNSPRLRGGAGDLAGRIVVTRMLSPPEVTLLHQHGVSALVLEQGSSFAHAAILARSLGIPALIGVHSALALLAEDDELILDGHYGVLFVMHPERLRRHYHDKLHDQRFHAGAGLDAGTPVRTKDGIALEIYLNTEDPADIAPPRGAGLAGVGLMRTEFLFLDRSPADEETQLAQYRAMLAAGNGRPVTIRTLDIGGDKPLAGYKPVGGGENPALGLRAVRLTLHHSEFMRRQLRALLRAACDAPLRILLPLITTAGEIRLVRHMMQQLLADLPAAERPPAEHLALGAMIETPAAALAIHTLLPEVDFIAIGTNDLSQYTLAADRLDPAVGYLYDPLHPALLKLIAHVIEQARERGVPVSLCGEMAAEPKYAGVLVGLGLRAFSVHAGAVAELAHRLRTLDASRCRSLVQRALQDPKLDPQTLLAALDDNLPPT